MAASQIKLDTLPKELIVLIAEKLDLLSALSLAATSKLTCHTIHHGLVFKTILTTSQTQNWNSSSLDLEAISHRASKDPSTWLRFAVADYRAWRDYSSGKRQPLYDACTAWLPELHLVHHPHVGRQFLPIRLPSSPPDPAAAAGMIFSRILFSLAGDQPWDSVFHTPSQSSHSRDGEPEGSTILLTLEQLLFSVRTSLHARGRIWPYNDDAQVPYIPLPKHTKIPLRPVNDTYTLPLPFSRQTHPESSRGDDCGDWTRWFRAHLQALFYSDDFLIKGSWCGYYTHFHSNSSGRMDPLAEYVPPPMRNIILQITGQTFANTIDREAERRRRLAVHLKAEEAYDGDGKFSLTGTMSLVDGVVQFRGKKKTAGDEWSWDCELTPFGLVGFWGRGKSHAKAEERRGNVWLWKEEWMEIKDGEEEGS